MSEKEMTYQSEIITINSVFIVAGIFMFQYLTQTLKIAGSIFFFCGLIGLLMILWSLFKKVVREKKEFEDITYLTLLVPITLILFLGYLIAEQTLNDSITETDYYIALGFSISVLFYTGSYIMHKLSEYIIKK